MAEAEPDKKAELEKKLGSLDKKVLRFFSREVTPSKGAFYEERHLGVLDYIGRKILMSIRVVSANAASSFKEISYNLMEDLVLAENDTESSGVIRVEELAISSENYQKFLVEFFRESDPNANLSTPRKFNGLDLKVFYDLK